MLTAQFRPLHLFIQNQSDISNRGKRRDASSSIISREFGVLLQSCIEEKSFQRGLELHKQIRKAGFERNNDLLPKLLKLYWICGRAEDARKLFDKYPKRNLTVFVWTSMINGYIENGDTDRALGLFQEMLEFGIKPDSYTLSALLKACAFLVSPNLARQMHAVAIKSGDTDHLSVVNSLIHAYGSLGELESAKLVFDGASSRDVVSWTSMIRSLCLFQKYEQSMELFSRMQLEESLKPNEVTVASVLPACGFFSFLRRGQAIHGYVIRAGFGLNLIVGSALISMYCRCGDPDHAFQIFESFKMPNVVMWTSMIDGYSMNGRFNSALLLFETMQQKCTKPNHVTLVVILTACSHGGLLQDGLNIFNSMKERFGIEPQVEHQACVVDMLGRQGRLEEAEKFIQEMRLQPTARTYGSLLGACQVHCNVELGERLASKLFELEPKNAANYVVLSNIYASVGRWNDVGRLRRLMINKGVTKSPGCSWIEIKNKTWVFGAHDKSHPESQRIYRKLEDLGDEIAKAGYEPLTKFVLLDVAESDKKKLLCSHSERLAVAFGLMKVPLGPIRIAKNLRICGDCHEAIKLISKVTQRELIIRDTSRFHHFCLGSCSCGDYW